MLKRSLVGFGVLSLSATPLWGQGLNVNFRNGENLVYCGPTPGGPFFDNVFSTAHATHDEISVSDVGPPASTASALLFAAATTSGVSIEMSGHAGRGGPPASISAVAAAHDGWRFTIDAPVCFRFDISMQTAGTDGITAGQGYSFVPFSGGAGFVVDPGSTPEAFGGGLFAAGSLNRFASGRMLAGTYELDLSARAEGNNLWPYEGSYAHLAVLRLGLINDFDGNGVVDLADLAGLLAHFGQSGASHADGDSDGDGDVDLTDLTALLSEFGRAC